MTTIEIRSVKVEWAEELRQLETDIGHGDRFEISIVSLTLSNIETALDQLIDRSRNDEASAVRDLIVNHSSL